MKRTFVCIIAVMIAGCATRPRLVPFEVQFDHFFPDDSRYISKMYHDAYQKVMSAPQRHGDFGAASAGDAAALRRYLLIATTEAESLDGGKGEDYSSDLVFLLIRTGDVSFSSALRTLTGEEREAVGRELDAGISSERAWFPRTTSLYRHRWHL